MRIGEKTRRFFKILGPGLITGASDDDPSGIATYSQAGAGFGLATLWTALITFPLMAAVQEMCARIGMVTSLGLTGTLRKHYPRPVLYLLIAFSFPAIILNIGADIAGMGAVANLIFPSIHETVFSVFFTIVMLITIVYLPYRRIAAVMKYLCMFLLVYIVVPFLYDQDWIIILRATFIPTIHFNLSFVAMLVAILGTTISPYLFFWQATMEVEDMKQREKVILVDKNLIRRMKIDVNFGMLFSNVVMFFIILTTGTVLFKSNVHTINTVEQAAKALEPLAGDSAYLLFAVGVIGTGFLALPVLSGSLSYIISETFEWELGLDKKFHEAKAFYIVIALSMLIGLMINYVGISPVQALIYTALLYGITAPVVVAIVLHVANNRAVMGEYCNGLRANILGTITLVLMTACVLFMLYDQLW